MEWDFIRISSVICTPEDFGKTQIFFKKTAISWDEKFQ